MSTCLAAALRPLILHHCCEVTVRNPAARKTIKTIVAPGKRSKPIFLDDFFKGNEGFLLNYLIFFRLRRPEKPRFHVGRETKLGRH